LREAARARTPGSIGQARRLLRLPGRLAPAFGRFIAQPGGQQVAAGQLAGRRQASSSRRCGRGAQPARPLHTGGRAHCAWQLGATVARRHIKGGRPASSPAAQTAAGKRGTVLGGGRRPKLPLWRLVAGRRAREAVGEQRAQLLWAGGQVAVAAARCSCASVSGPCSALAREWRCSDSAPS